MLVLGQRGPETAKDAGSNTGKAVFGDCCEHELSACPSVASRLFEMLLEFLFPWRCGCGCRMGGHGGRETSETVQCSSCQIEGLFNVIDEQGYFPRH